MKKRLIVVFISLVLVVMTVISLTAAMNGNGIDDEHHFYSFNEIIEVYAKKTDLLNMIYADAKRLNIDLNITYISLLDCGAVMFFTPLDQLDCDTIPYASEIYVYGLTKVER